MDNKVLVKVDTMAICKADIRYFLGNRDINVLNHKYPLAPIHEAVGEVVKDPTGTYKKGDKVILVPNSFDDKFFSDNSNRRCHRKDLGDNYYPKAVFRSSTADGFLRNYYTCSPDLLVKYDESIAPSIAVFSELLSVATAALRRIDFNEVEKLALFGDGIMAYIVYIMLRYDHPDLDLTVFGIDDHKLESFKNAKTAKFESYKGEKFDTLIEAENYKQYLCSKFTRYLLKQGISSVNVTRECFNFVPEQDFTKEWTDKELYRKYHLSQAEIDYIESMIKPIA